MNRALRIDGEWNYTLLPGFVHACKRLLVTLLRGWAQSYARGSDAFVR